MNFIWNIKYSPKPPCVVSHYLYGDANRMKRNIEANGTAYISVNSRTKTSLDINLWYDKDCFAIAHIPAGAEKFKFVEASHYCFIDNTYNSRFYFRISKKQGLSELKEYLELVLAGLDLSVDTLNVDMNIIGVEQLKAA